MPRTITVDAEYLSRVRENFEQVCCEMSRNKYQPVQGKIREYIRKGEEMLGGASRFIGRETGFPDFLYHLTNSDNVPGIDQKGLLKSGDKRTFSQWSGRERSIVPGVYATTYPELKDWVPWYDRIVVVRTDEMNPEEFMWDEDAVSLTPLESLRAPGKAVYLHEIPRSWIISIETKRVA